MTVDTTQSQYQQNAYVYDLDIIYFIDLVLVSSEYI
jgi:hypothetical protein